jgi:steroid 5-alpha reductase family enzyme
MAVSDILFIIAQFAIPVMAVMWLVQRSIGDAGIVDAAWALLLTLSAIFIASVSAGAPERRLLVGVLSGFWSFRLGIYLLRDRVLAGEEDGRYRRMRLAMGRHAQLGFLGFFIVQAGFVVIFAAPVAAAAANPEPLALLDFFGIGVGVVAIIGEIIADRQLAAFRCRPDSAGKTCRDGLWRYSRHPNYFFEWLHWFAYALIAAGGPAALLGYAGPIVVFVFLFTITGIPHTEKQAASHRPDYADYQRTTSIFIPWPPKPDCAIGLTPDSGGPIDVDISSH